jgi:2-amino-4-hydroxy-6-hydroxymethyldihydropteridine diphosphokinase
MVNDLTGTKILKASRIIETRAIGGPKHQAKFLNAALKIKTSIAPQKLLRCLKAIEKGLGRTTTVRNGPRTIDLDILLYGDKIIRHKDLEVPHPRMCERAFVIKPLLEVL